MEGRFAAVRSRVRRRCCAGSRRCGWFVVAWLVVASCWSRTTQACGVWSVRDKTQGWRVVFRATAIDVVHPAEEGKARRVRSIATIARPSTQYDWRVLQRKPAGDKWAFGDKAFATRGATLLFEGKTVGRVSRQTIELGGEPYQIVFSAWHEPAGPYSQLPDNAGRGLTVTRGGRVVLEGVALGPPHCAADPVRLIAFYLAWRERFRRRSP
jgi:hypothetical protein